MKLKYFYFSVLVALQILALPAYAKTIIFSNLTMDLDDSFIKLKETEDRYVAKSVFGEIDFSINVFPIGVVKEDDNKRLMYDWLEMAKTSSNPEEKVIYNKHEVINNYDVVHTIVKQQGKVDDIIGIKYVIMRPLETYVIMYRLNETIYKEKKTMLKDFMNTIEFKVPMRRIELGNTNFTYELPVDFDCFIDIPCDPSGGNVFFSSKGEFFTFVMMKSLEKYPELPKQIDNLSDKELVKIDSELKQNISKNSSNGVENWKLDYTVVNNLKCLNYNYDDGDTHINGFGFIENDKFVFIKFACPANEQEKYTEITGLIVKTISKQNINK